MSDNISIKLFNNADDFLLHVSLHQEENAIIFNSRNVRGEWGCEDRERVQGTFENPSINIIVCDHGDKYQVLFSYQTVHYCKKENWWPSYQGNLRY